MTIQNTPVYALPYPQSGDPADGPSQIGALANRLEVVLGPIDTAGKAKDTTIGVLSARPAFGTAGRRYFATDVVAEYIDTGTAWLRTTIPSGAMSAILAAVAPSGWLLCDGTAITNTGIYVELYAAIGATRPDLRGRVPVGVDGAAARMTANDALANTGGIEKYVLQQTDLPSHVHPVGTLAVGATGSVHHHRVDWQSIASGAAGTNWQALINGAGNAGATSPSGDDGSHTHNLTGSTGGTGSGTSHENMPPYQVVNWIVKL